MLVSIKRVADPLQERENLLEALLLEDFLAVHQDEDPLLEGDLLLQRVLRKLEMVQLLPVRDLEVPVQRMAVLPLRKEPKLMINIRVV